jgi:hypothetical protein
VGEASARPEEHEARVRQRVVKKRKADVRKKRKPLPFDVPHAPFHSRKASRDFSDLEKAMTKLVSRFGFLRVAKALVHMAGDQSLENGGSVLLYREASTHLGHALDTIRTIRDLARTVNSEQ